MSGPYDRAEEYRKLGWTGTIPLDLGSKWPPPAGVTGDRGRMPTADDLLEWRTKGWVTRDDETGKLIKHRAGNIALRLPPVIIGLDVDAYSDKQGARAFADLEARLGELPATWRSSSRDDGISGIRLYRIPAGLSWPNQAGPNIEIIRHGHRYVVAWPSLHPDGGVYRWIGPDGADTPPPPFGEIPELPAAWVAGLTGGTLKGEPRTSSLSVDREDRKTGRAWIAQLPAGEPCPLVAERTAAALSAARRELGNAYDHTRDALLSLLRAGETGHPGVRAGLTMVRDVYVATVADARPESVATAEFYRLADGGAALILATPGDRAGRGCDCKPPAADDEKGVTTDDTPGERQDDQANPLRACTECGDTTGACPCWSGISDQLERQVDALLSELLDTADLDNIPALEPLVADVLFLDTVTRLHGPSGTFKSFLTLSLAGAIGTGTPWHDRAVRQGNVVYIVAEGVKGMRKRVRAWEQHHGIKMAGVKFLPRPVQVRSPEWSVLVEVCRRLQTVLIIIDTQARVTVGVNENDNTEMGVVLDLMERMRVATGACVLVVHHSGHENTERGRGASAVKGGMQTELSVIRKGKDFNDTRITLDMPKQKDDEEASVGTFRPYKVQLDGEVKDDGSPVTSVVLLADTEEFAGTGIGNWLVEKLDAAGIPDDYSNAQTRKAVRDMNISAGNETIAEAVRVRKSRTNVRSGESRNGGQFTPFREARNGNGGSPGRAVPGTVAERSGTASPDDRSAFRVLKDAERSEAQPGKGGKDGPTGLCDVCFKTMTIKGNMTRHTECRPPGEAA